MKTNEQLQQDVEDAIRFEPLLGDTEIGVTVQHGIVTLMGTVDSYAKKIEAETAAKNVAGVKALIEKIEVATPSRSVHPDEEIAAGVVKALQIAWAVPSEKVKVKIQHGWVYLEGDLLWDYQRDAAKKAASDVPGVKGVINDIHIKSNTRDFAEEHLITNAFKRHWSLKSANINVEAVGTHVILRGIVDSIYQKEEAARLAWKTPGVWSVDNELTVEYLLPK